MARPTGVTEPFVFNWLPDRLARLFHGPFLSIWRTSSADPKLDSNGCRCKNLDLKNTQPRPIPLPEIQGLSREDACAYVGVSTSKLDQMSQVSQQFS